LIERKCGRTVAQVAADRAGAVLEAGPPGSDEYLAALGELDFWLRADGNRRNPGTTADLVAAGLFALLRDGRLPPPWR
jgi:triphosphoribosyl-dephospho-CoA synthase